MTNFIVNLRYPIQCQLLSSRLLLTVFKNSRDLILAIGGINVFATLGLTILIFFATSGIGYATPYFNSLNHDTLSGIEKYGEKFSHAGCIDKMVPDPVVEINCAPIFVKIQ